jgi:4-amino-4-deoxy-L-arabinose transferase-like glycosyltransferase
MTIQDSSNPTKILIKNLRAVMAHFWYENKILIGIIILAILLRFYQLGEIPVGLNQDEASMTIESKALLETGADRWGNRLPVYFASWGSGQNVLLSYLTIPFVYFFGVSVWSTRIVSAILGVVAVFLIYKFVKIIQNKTTALWSAGLLCILPWHLVASRWGLESNILPVFLLFGIYLVARLLQNGFHRFDPTQKWLSSFKICLDYFSLIPFALCVYAYGTGVVVVPVIFALITIFYLKIILQNWKKWLVCMGFFLVSFAPIGLFVFKNYISKTNYDWEKYLPFTAPLLPVTRLDQVGNDRFQIWSDNYSFVVNGLKDNLPWNTIPNFGTIPEFLIIFALIALFFGLKTLRENRLYGLVLIWLVSCIGNFALIPTNVNRGNVIFLPIVILMATGINFVAQNFNYKKQFYVAILTIISLYSILFLYNYFIVYPTKFNFPKDLEQPFSLIKNSKQPVLVSNQLPIHYIYILFHTNYPIQDFQKENQNTNYDVRKVGNFYIDPAWLVRDGVKNYDFLLGIGQKACENEQITYQNSDWKVGWCEVKSK